METCSGLRPRAGTDGLIRRGRPAPLEGVSLVNMRVVQRTLVYLIGLSPSLADENVLTRYEFLGQYGEIKKIVVNKANAFNHSAGLSYSAYITFLKEEDAAKCIQALKDFTYENRSLTATFGTTKYCSFFLKNILCPRQDCLYLHEYGVPEDNLTRDIIQQSAEIAPSDSPLNLVRIIVQEPVSTVFPPAHVVRLRNWSVEYLSARLFEAPRRKNSRYDFVEESKETPVEVPGYIIEILQTNSPVKETATVDASTFRQILDPNSPEKWLSDLIEPCEEASEDAMIQVRAKVALSH